MLNKDFEDDVQWNLETGYMKSDLRSHIFPYRAIGAGAKAGLNLYLLDLIGENDMLCRNGQQGFKVRFIKNNYFHFNL